MRGIYCLAIAAGLLLGGCAWNGNHGGYVQFYNGQPLPKEQVALITGHNNYRDGSATNDMVRIVAIDDKPVPSEFGVAEGANEVAVKPGLHSVRAFYVSGYSDIDLYSYKTLQIEAKPGCHYEVSTQIMMPTKMVHFDVLASPLSVNSREDCRIEDDPPSRRDSLHT